MEKEAVKLKMIFKKNSFQVSSCRCFINRIKKSDITPFLKRGVNRNYLASFYKLKGLAAP